MASKSRKTETVKVSRLGCMRKSTVETDMTGRTVEHVTVWVDEPTMSENEPRASGDPSSPKDKSG